MFRNILLIIIIIMFYSAGNMLCKTPVIYITDLYHPYQDLDDHFDLVALYALKDFDIKAIIIDHAEKDKIPGKIPIQQINKITGRDITYYLGLDGKLKTPEDKCEEQSYCQEGCNAILDILKNSSKKVIIISVGSLRNIAAAYNRNPSLYNRKVDKTVIFAGEASDENFTEYNVSLDKSAYFRVMNNISNIYWIPCFDGGIWSNKGFASYWKAPHVMLLKGCTPALLNYFLYAITESSDTVNYISDLYKSSDSTELHNFIYDNNKNYRNLWCCSVFPYFTSNNKSVFPFTFKKVKVTVDNNAVLHYSLNGNIVKRFKITDLKYYSNKMTAIYNKIIRSLN